MQQITREDRVLGLLLGLGDIAQSPPCMKYANACQCKDCLERERLIQEAVARATPLQPWEARPPRKQAA